MESSSHRILAKKRQRRAAKKSRTADASVGMPESCDSAIREGLNLQRAGQLDQAKLKYCQVLERAPNNPDALHLLGMTLFAAGECMAALEFLLRANDVIPNHPSLLANLGIVHRALGDFEAAKNVLHRSIALDPNQLSARNTLGTVLLALSDAEAAEAQFQAVLDVDPSFENAAMNLANAWQQLGRLRDAEFLYRRILKDDPHDVATLNNLGETLRKQRKCDESLLLLTQAVAVSPGFEAASINLGRTLSEMGRYQDAIAQFESLIERRPDLPKPHHYLGKALIEAGDFQRGQATLERALALAPSDFHVHCSLGSAYREASKPVSAARCFREAMRLRPSASNAHSSLLFVLSADPSICPQALFEEHCKWGVVHGSCQRIATLPIDGRRDRPLRIGYVSADFRNHPVASFFRPVLESHCKEAVESYCYAEVAAPDETTRQLQNKADHWRFTVGLSDFQVAEQIVNDKIDVLVDLAGHTAGSRIKAFAHRPAPVQITWLGYPNTTGLDTMDYRLTCSIQNPVNEPSYHTEELIRMPDGAICFSPPRSAPSVTPLPCHRNGYITFGSLHRPFKITSGVCQMWANVLLANASSRLLLLNHRFTDESASVFREAMSQRGIESGRIEIRRDYKAQDYLRIYQDIDIGLDTTPWAGGTTTMEALWMGVPVVGFYGDRRSARSTAAILDRVGLGDLIGHSPDEYVRLATQLSADVPRLDDLRSELRGLVQETICNADAFTRQLESTLRHLWERYADSLAEETTR